MIEAEGGRRQRWTAATTAADGGAPDGTDAACTGTPGTSRQVVSQGDAGLTLLRSLEPDDPHVLSPPTRTSSNVPLRRRNWSFFFWFILLSSFLFEFRSISEDFCAFSSDRWKEKRSSKFQLDRFLAIFDQISNPSRFYQISIRIFLVSFKKQRKKYFSDFSKSCVSNFGCFPFLFIYLFLILFCENVTVFFELNQRIICSIRFYIFEFIRGYVDFLATSTNDWQISINWILNVIPRRYKM